MKILCILKKAFRTQYRLTVFVDGRYRDTYCNNSRMVKSMAIHSPYGSTWTIYKSGPFGLPEREVESGKQCALRFTRREKCVHHPGRRKTKGYGQ